MLKRIVSGGQTGVDRAALDVALSLEIACGGWCPQGRRAEDGPIDDRYPLRETPWWGYPQRTEWNVRDSDGTLILVHGRPESGTALTVELARKWRRPYLIFDLDKSVDLSFIHHWIQRNQIETLNVAGPRESGCPGIYREVADLLYQVLTPIPFNEA